MINETVFYEVVSKLEYKEEAVTVDKPKENKFLDSLQFGLDIAGLVPGLLPQGWPSEWTKEIRKVPSK